MPHPKFNTGVIFVTAFLGIVFQNLVLAQSQKNELESEKQQLEKAIEYTNGLLEDTRNSKKATLNELTLLNNKISKREKLLQNYRKEQSLLNDSVFMMLQQIDKSSTEIELLKDEYARMVYSAYKNDNIYQRMVYVLAAEDFNQAYQRLSYYREYSSYRKKQIALIEAATKEYSVKVGMLEIKVAENDALLASLNEESEQLQYEKDLKKGTIANLKKQEKELIKSQANYQKKANELKKRIEQIITEDIASSVPGSVANSKTELNMTPAEEIVSNNFSLNQGRLPWPSERGVVSSGFGEQEHPDLKGIKIRNNGINIISQKNANARAVFDGEVTRVLSVPNFNNVVIIRHGDYLTVYSNLDEVFVKKGATVKTKEEIGSIFTDHENFKTELHFEIWKGKTLLDPLRWLANE
jgi:murein DD-endopeptidase MepM/ murein hydrolase activator NlpD